AGFTSELLCVVWVGFDDNRDLGLEGAQSALPIWTEFMKSAMSIPRYADPHPFEPPKGVVRTGDAGPGGAVFLAGTQPKHHARVIKVERSQKDQFPEPIPNPASSQELSRPTPSEDVKPTDVPPTVPDPQSFDRDLPEVMQQGIEVDSSHSRPRSNP